MDASATPGTPRLLRMLNDRTGLDLLLELGPLSRVQICELTGLSKPTASKLLARLEAAGLVRPVGTSSGGPGRNAVLYGVDGSVAQVGAVDVRPRRTTARITDLAGTVLAEEHLPVGGGDRSPAATVRAALEAAGRAAGVRADALHSVAISIGGAYDEATDRLSLLGGTPGWSAPDALASVRAALAPATVLVENDVKLAAVAERAQGVARTATSFAVLWVSAGLGLASDVGGMLHRGATGGAGEIGYMPVLGGPSDQRPRDFQDLVGAPAVQALAREHGIRARSAAQAVARACAAGDPASEAFVDELASRLASGLAVITSVLDPHLVVLSGDICTAGGEHLARRVERALRRMSKLRPALMVSGVDGDPALAGATELALRHTRDALFRASAEALMGNVR